MPPSFTSYMFRYEDPEDVDISDLAQSIPLLQEFLDRPAGNQLDIRAMIHWGVKAIAADPEHSLKVIFERMLPDLYMHLIARSLEDTERFILSHYALEEKRLALFILAQDMRVASNYGVDITEFTQFYTAIETLFLERESIHDEALAELPPEL